MVQVYIDDSGLDGVSPVFILAGVAAFPEEWDKFKVEWDAVLKAAPAIAYFKMSEAYSRKGEFCGFSDAQLQDKIDALIAVLRRNVMGASVVSIEIADYFDVLPSKISITTDRPYHMAAQALIAGTIRSQWQAGVNHPIDFIFDEQGTEQVDVMELWKQLEHSASPDVRSRLGKPPVWGNDKEILPLQAADLIAWLCRRTFIDGGDGRDINASKVSELFRGKMPIPIECFLYGKQEFQSMLSHIKSLHGGTIEYEDKRSRKKRLRQRSETEKHDE